MGDTYREFKNNMLAAEVVEELASLRSRIEELEAALSKSIMHQKELDRCVHLTEEQIDDAWRLHGPAVGTAAIGVFRDLGIVGCDECDEMGQYQEIDHFEWVDCPACHRNGKSHGWIWKEKS